MNKCKDCDYFMDEDQTFNSFCNMKSKYVDEDDDICEMFKGDEEFKNHMCIDCKHLRIAGDGHYICGVDCNRVYGRGPACPGFTNRGYKMVCSNCKNYNAYWKDCKVTGKCVGEINACEFFTYKEDKMLEIKDDSQEAKADSGKLKITLVPRQIIKDIAEVRMYGNKKYGSPDNWKQVEAVRYRDALMRHLLAYLDDPDSVDEESGIKHLKHIACNVAFLCEMEDKE